MELFRVIEIAHTFCAQRFGSVTAGQGRSIWKGDAVPPFTAPGWLASVSIRVRRHPRKQRPLESEKTQQPRENQI